MKKILLESITYHYHPKKQLPYGLVAYFTGNKKIKIDLNDTTYGVSKEGYFEDFFSSFEERYEKESLIRKKYD